MNKAYENKRLAHIAILLALFILILGCGIAQPGGSDAAIPEESSNAARPSTGVLTQEAKTVAEDVVQASATLSPSPAAISRATETPALAQGSAATSASKPDASTQSLAIPTAIPTATLTASPTPASPAPTARPAAGSNTRLLRKKAAEIQLDGSQGLVKDGEAIQLAKQADGTYVGEGILLSEQYQADFPFNNAVFSWNAESPAGTRLEFQLRAGKVDEMSPWFTMGTWSASGGASAGAQSSAWGSVDVDTLKLTNNAATLQYRVIFTTSSPRLSPRLSSIAVVYSDMGKPLTGAKPALLDGWQRDLPVPQYSQLEQDPAVARSICSPTSLAMVLNYWGKGKSVREVYQGVRDARIGIYGNWPLNAAYAGSLGFDAYVDRFYSVEQLQNEIAQGRPVIISIRFDPGELDNSPLNSTSGHLIVVRGFTQQGDFIVNDPFGSNSSKVRVVYKRDQLAKIWQNSGGVVYIVRPR